MAYSIGGAFIKSMDLTRSWGLTPASATVVAMGGSGVPTGSNATVNVGGVVFSGVVTSSTPNEENGRMVNLTISDNRIRLGWDTVYCVFNIAEVLEDDPSQPFIQRTKRFKHIHPDDWEAQTWSYSKKPLTASEILGVLFAAKTVQFRFSYRGAKLNQPVYALDANTGKKLGSVLQELCDSLGVLLTIEGSQMLVFETKGSGAVPQPNDSNSANRSNGSAIGGDTRVRIVGERNVYQDGPIFLEPDWVRAYEKFLFKPAWIQEVKNKFAIVDISEAAARAHEITLREYCAKVGKEYADYSIWADVSRMEIPVWTYISDIIFKSYRIPRSYTINKIPLTSLLLREGLLAGMKISESGIMEYILDELYPEAKGFCAVKGLPLSIIDLVSSDALTPQKLTKVSSTWKPINNFSLDTKNNLVIFDEPIFISNDLYIQANPGASGELAKIMVPNAKAVISPAQIVACFSFEAEKYGKWFGSGNRNGTQYVQGLNYHVLMKSNSWYREIAYANDSNSTADKLAAAAGNSFLSGQDYLQSGGYDRYGAVGMALTGSVDRVTATIRFESGGEGEGLSERVEYAKERAPTVFQSERELERRQRTKDLFPGQAALKDEARNLRTLGKIIKGSKGSSVPSLKSVDQTTRRLMGNPSPATTLALLDSAKTYPVGMPVFVDGKNIVAATSKSFAGVITTANTPPISGSHIPVAPQGVVPCRVKGPINVGDSVGVDDRADFASKGGSKYIGIAQQAHPGSDAKIIFVRLGGGGAGPGDFPFKLFMRQKLNAQGAGIPGVWQGRIEAKSSLFKARGLWTSTHVITGLTQYDASGQIKEISWFTLLPTDAIWLQIGYNGSGVPTTFTIKSWGLGEAWANLDSPADFEGSNPAKSRYPLAFTLPDSTGTPVIQQDEMSNLVMVPTCSAGHGLLYPTPTHLKPYKLS